jgi:hypothetical protein
MILLPPIIGIAPKTKTSVDFYSTRGFCPQGNLLVKATNLLPPTEFFQAYSLRPDDNNFSFVCQRNSVERVLSGEKVGAP